MWLRAQLISEGAADYEAPSDLWRWNQPFHTGLTTHSGVRSLFPSASPVHQQPYCFRRKCTSMKLFTKYTIIKLESYYTVNIFPLCRLVLCWSKHFLSLRGNLLTNLNYSDHSVLVLFPWWQYLPNCFLYCKKYSHWILSGNVQGLQNWNRGGVQGVCISISLKIE